MSWVRAIRGATTLDSDDADQMTRRVQELMQEIFKQNSITQEDVISILFSATSDISSKFPASAARGLGLDDVPLFGTQELTVENMVPLCVRVMFHVNTDLQRSEINHVYLHGAQNLRKDLAK